ncbi:MAG: hypothetical protein N2037_06590 [Acidimicrobiales bacterium]|nr:hypothetical protein [Acidimicrobiales bacterium]
MNGPGYRNVAPLREPPWPTDLPGLCERLAQRLRKVGVEHPDVAAVALVVRGIRGETVEEFAATLGIDAPVVEAVEAGEHDMARAMEAYRSRPR